MKKISFFVLSAFVFISLNAQNYMADFTKALRDNDTTGQKEILDLWEKSNDRSADYYIANFNYFFAKADANSSSMQLSTEKPTSGKYLTIYDSTTNVTGYLTPGDIDRELFNKSISYINEGIKKYPQRLDLRFGKIYALYNALDWDDFTTEIIKTIDYSYIIDNKWIYPNENADKDFFLQTIYGYVEYLYEALDFEQDSVQFSLQTKRMRNISEAILKYYPDNVEALNFLGVSYFFGSDYTKALEIFLKAEKINPKDAIVLFNIANIYSKQGDKIKARQYYENIINNCDEQAKEEATQLLKEL